MEHDPSSVDFRENQGHATRNNDNILRALSLTSKEPKTDGKNATNGMNTDGVGSTQSDKWKDISLVHHHMHIIFIKIDDESIPASAVFDV
eukprot:scaffold3782_cov170-Amphora_coffeaeformis.AAC.7